MKQHSGQGLTNKTRKKIENKKIAGHFIILRYFVFVLSLFIVLFGPYILMSNTENYYYFSSSSSEMREVTGFLFSDYELSSFSALEASHMQDVKNLVLFSKWFFVFSLSFLFGYFSYYNDKFLLKKIGKFGLVLQGVLLVLILVSFRFVFTWFHKIFFPMGNWQFESSSLLIQLFPERFFLVSAIFGSLISFFVFLFCYYKGRS
jgi:integral membrane protein (TIGR01906 family)